LRCLARCRCFVLEVPGGDLEAVEDEAGAVDVNLVGSEADDDLAEGLLQGAAVGGRAMWKPRPSHELATGWA